MKYHYLIFYHVIVSITIIVASAIDEVGILKRMEEANSLFTQEGPTSNVLEHYEQMVKEIEGGLQLEGGDVELKIDSGIKNQLPQVYYIKALIEINLNKDGQAISDLLKAWKLGSGSTPAKARLVELYLERGDMVALKSVVGDEDANILQKIAEWEGALGEANKLLKKGKYKECIDELESKVLSVSPSSVVGYETHLACALGAYKGQIDVGESNSAAKMIISDLAKLIKLQPIHNLQWYDSISQFLLFGECEFEKAKQFVKNCLRIDNDFKDCGSDSKFLSRFGSFFKTLEAYSIVDGHFYMASDSDSNSAREHVDEDFNFEEIKSLLFTDEIKAPKLEKNKLPRKIHNNYDYLMYKAVSFITEKTGSQKSISSLKFVDYLNRLSCETLIQVKDYKGAEKYCSLVKEEDFLPKFIPEIDRLVRAKKFSEANEIMKRFSGKGVKHSKLFASRYKPIESHLERQERQRQRQHQQQQQQRQQQYHQYQQQQRQAAAQNTKPKNDYYKILGVAKDADDKTIKKAYRSQTLKYHPDKYKGNDLTPEQIENKMQDINQAYEILSNKELRERYDRGDDPNDPLGPQRQQQHQQHYHNPFAGGGGGGGQQFHFNFGNFNFGGQKVKIKRNKKRAA